MDNWQAFVEFNPGMMTNSVYLARQREYGVREYLKSDNTIVTMKQGERLTDQLWLAQLDEDQMRALVAAFDKHGVKPPEASFTQGKLEATESHLADMRKVVFKDKTL